MATNPFVVCMEWVKEGIKAVCPCKYCKSICTTYYNTNDTALIAHNLLQVTNTQELTDNDQAAVANLFLSSLQLVNWDGVLLEPPIIIQGTCLYVDCQQWCYKVWCW